METAILFPNLSPSADYLPSADDPALGEGASDFVAALLADLSPLELEAEAVDGAAGLFPLIPTVPVSLAMPDWPISPTHPNAETDAAPPLGLPGKAEPMRGAETVLAESGAPHAQDVLPDIQRLVGFSTEKTPAKEGLGQEADGLVGSPDARPEATALMPEQGLTEDQGPGRASFDETALAGLTVVPDALPFPDWHLAARMPRTAGQVDQPPGLTRKPKGVVDIGLPHPRHQVPAAEGQDGKSNTGESTETTAMPWGPDLPASGAVRSRPGAEPPPLPTAFVDRLPPASPRAEPTPSPRAPDGVPPRHTRAVVIHDRLPEGPAVRKAEDADGPTAPPRTPGDARALPQCRTPESAFLLQAAPDPAPPEQASPPSEAEPVLHGVNRPLQTPPTDTPTLLLESDLREPLTLPTATIAPPHRAEAAQPESGHGLAHKPEAPVSQVVQAIVTALPDRPDQIDVILHPEDLGSLRFEIRRHGEHLQFVLSADRPETLDLMRRNLPDLLAELRQAGIEGTSFSFGPWSQRGQPDRQAERPSPPTADAARSVPPPALPAPPPQRWVPTGALDVRL